MQIKKYVYVSSDNTAAAVEQDDVFSKGVSLFALVVKSKIITTIAFLQVIFTATFAVAAVDNNAVGF